jgi:hypothetical protein
MAETAQINAESTRILSKARKLNTEAGKVSAEETKIATESRWYPWAVIGGVFTVLAAVAKLFVH